jgi:hypothetical protein
LWTGPGKLFELGEPCAAKALIHKDRAKGLGPPERAGA